MATGEAGEVGGVSLSAPRPIAARANNEYVETPLHRGSTSLSAPSSSDNNKKQQVNKNTKRREGGGGGGGGGGGSGRGGGGVSVGVLTRQPTLGSSNGKKEGGGGRRRGEGGIPALPPPPPCSIICPSCGKCRCVSCRSPRRTPSVWLCSNFCLCSLDSCVDYASCLCCVKGLMYHWSSGEEEEASAWADDPCSCSSTTRWLPRWACLAFTSLFLPCLCCYCPLRTCADGCERGYAACSDRGCNCPPQT